MTFHKKNGCTHCLLARWCSVKKNGCTHCLLGRYIFISWFFVVCWIFSKSIFLKNSFRNTIRVSNSLDPDQAEVFWGLILVQTVCKGFQQTTVSRYWVQWIWCRNGVWPVFLYMPTVILFCLFYIRIQAATQSKKGLYFILNSEINAYQKQIKVISITSEMIWYQSLVTDISLYFHCSVFWITSVFSIHLMQLTSKVQTPITFLFVNKNTKCG